MHFTFSKSIDDIVDYLREKLYHTNFTIHKKNLQHWDVSLAGWVDYFESRGEAKPLTKHLVPAVNTMFKFVPVLAFKVRRIFNVTTEISQQKKMLEKKER